MKNKLFLYGKQNTGKSTIIRKVLKECQINPKGFLTVADKADYIGKWNLYIQPADWDYRTFPIENKIAVCCGNGDWKSYPEVFETVGVMLLTFKRKPEIVIMDEIGFMESKSLNFQRRILEILDEPFPVLGVIKPRPNDFMQRIYDHKNVAAIEITEKNRDDAAAKLINMFKVFEVNKF